MSFHMLMNPLGMTFSQAAEALAQAQSRDRFRQWYGQLMRGEGEVEGLLPVVRHVQDGELIKFIQRRDDGLEIESVIIPMWRGGSRWTTLCVSSQIGCAMGCTFCETAQLGLLRSLSAA